ncbi:hypothetical protein RM533_08465 [Croceicoccus sp. F390]|uniref:EF-hand domain-containing protein n=1 Tax=Croceicoccus esteveae TaxID=3075597 RepID=A0ABU2ZHX4_9SPHN|nr:hypothetical protein [Croceicoccus sp. F390]MDT0576218.1 hypothetical protein [Croceicoccus sp. F390]
MCRSSHLVVVAALIALSACGDSQIGADTDDKHTAAPAVASPVPKATTQPGVARALFSFDGLDLDDDGFVSAAEHATGWAKTFKAMDADGDGTLLVAEMDAARSAIGRLSALSSERLIAGADQDNNSRLTLAEYVASSNSNFERRDADGDGKISLVEWQAAEAAAADVAAVPRE